MDCLNPSKSNVVFTELYKIRSLASSEDLPAVSVLSGDIFRAYLKKLAGEIPVGLSEEVVVE